MGTENTIFESKIIVFSRQGIIKFEMNFQIECSEFYFRNWK
jgi:hypothetical protein